MIHHGLTEQAQTGPALLKMWELAIRGSCNLAKYNQEVLERARQTIQSNVKIEQTDPLAFKTIYQIFGINWKNCQKLSEQHCYSALCPPSCFLNRFLTRKSFFIFYLLTVDADCHMCTTRWCAVYTLGHCPRRKPAKFSTPNAKVKQIKEKDIKIRNILSGALSNVEKRDCSHLKGQLYCNFILAKRCSI